MKNFEELAQKTSQEKINLHTTEVNNLKKQIEDITKLHQSQLSQVNNLQTEKLKTLMDQVGSLEGNQVQKDKLISQANDVANNYKKQLQEAQTKSAPNIILYIIFAVIIGIILGLMIGKSG